MKRIIYLVLLITPFVVCGALFKNFATDIFPYLVFYAAALTIIRQRYIKMTWKEILKSPFILNLKEKNRIFTDK
jgi:hypothetical protein